MMYDTSDIRKNLKVLVDGEPHVVVDFQFVKPGKGNAFTRTRLKSLVTGNVLDRTYRSGEKLEKADFDQRTVQYLYEDGNFRVFMDTETYEQFQVESEKLGDTVSFLVDGLPCELLLFAGSPLSVDLPNFVELEVVDVGAGSTKDKVSGATKDATMSTGLVIQVPVFIERGEFLKVDTRTGEYVERVKK